MKFLMFLAVCLAISVSFVLASSIKHRHRYHHHQGKDSCGVPTKLTKKEQTAILKAHNDVRQNEKAKKMPDLKWDDNLASKAQELTDTCNFAHGLQTGCDGQWMGQNVYGISDSTDAIKAVPTWASERTNFNLGTMTCDSGKVCGHYTQLVWAKTTKVGCAATANCGGEVSFIVVCNYSPTGNYPGQNPFEPS